MALFQKASGQKKIDPAKPSDTLPSTQAQEPTLQETETMTKPTAYFSIQEHTFMVMGRKENKGKEIPSTELALYFEGEVMAIPFQPMESVPERMKYIKTANLKELAALLDKGYPEETTTILMRELGYKELVKTLKDNKILCLDFLQFIKEELAKIPAKTRGRQKGSGAGKSKTDRSIQPLVFMLSSLAPEKEPEELAEMLKEMVQDDAKMQKAISILEDKQKENGRDEAGFIRLRIRTKVATGSPKIKVKR